MLWQVLTLTAGALVFGLLIGSVIGRLAWQAFARELGVASDSTGAPLALLAIAGGAIVLALLAAVVPATIAARTRPTSSLHVE